MPASGICGSQRSHPTLRCSLATASTGRYAGRKPARSRPVHSAAQCTPCHLKHLTAAANPDAYRSHLTFVVVVSISPPFGFSLCLADLAAGQPPSRHRRIRISTHANVAWDTSHSMLSIGGSIGRKRDQVFFLASAARLRLMKATRSSTKLSWTCGPASHLRVN